MQKCLFASSAAFLLLVLASSALVGLPPGGARTGARILRAANALLESLGDEQEKIAAFDYASEERFNWHFIPRERKGVPLKDLKEDQRAKVTALLQASLSEAGAKKAEEIRGLEDILRGIEGPERRFPRDPLLYYVTVFGKPSKDSRWGWRFEGHHLALNFTLNGTDLVSSTPLVQGANPALVREGPRKGFRALPGQEDIARELVTSLAPDLLKAARGEGKPEEVPGTEKAAYTGPFPPGAPADKLSADQKKTLERLIREYVQNLSDDAALGVLQALEGGMKDVQFCWRGGLKAGEGHSYMVHGPGFMINYINEQNDAYHVHSCLRMLRGEFGLEAKS